VIIISPVSVSLKIMLVNIILHNFLLKSVDKMTRMIFKFNYQLSVISYQLSVISYQGNKGSRAIGKSITNFPPVSCLLSPIF
jgi:ribonuclease D